MTAAVRACHVSGTIIPEEVAMPQARVLLRRVRRLEARKKIREIIPIPAAVPTLMLSAEGETEARKRRLIVSLALSLPYLNGDDIASLEPILEKAIGRTVVHQQMARLTP